MNASDVISKTAEYIGYTKAEMAAVIGISEKTYSRRIAEPGTWKMEELERIARLARWSKKEWLEAVGIGS